MALTLGAFGGLGGPSRLVLAGATLNLTLGAAIVGLVAEGYVREGKRYVTIGIGCTGGKHRSVAMVERLAQMLRDEGHQVVVQHRDLGRE